MDYSIFDIETTGLSVDSKVHCMVVNQVRRGISTIFQFTKLQDIKDYLLSEDTLVGHNIIRFDIPVLEKNLGITIQHKLIDTLGISWYLDPEKPKHGLEYWGEYFGVPKPEITDWENLSIEEYLHRCSEDVRINTALFDMQMQYLRTLYVSDAAIDRILNYITFKLKCAREQEEVRWKLDIERCMKNLNTLQTEIDAKTEALRQAMPPEVEYKTVAKPVKETIKDGSLSVASQKWYHLLGSLGYPIDREEPITYEVSRKPGNPGSVQQIKSWLYSLGWVPQTFKYVREPSGAQRAVPQVSKQLPEVGICDSIPLLYDKEPALSNLESLGMLEHRRDLLKGFLKNVSEDGYVRAEIAGFTNTMRFKHAVLVNLPTIHVRYGQEVRSCLICPEGYVLCGTDMSGLEDTTKQHYMYFFDPEYVKEMRTPGFDPHIDLALLAGMITPDDAEFYKQVDFHKTVDLTTAEPETVSRFKKIKSIRVTKAKKTNFASIYGAKPPKIALTANISLREANALYRAYWSRNKSVKQVSAAAEIKKVGNQMWLFNPVSRFWYTLRFEKDIFSTLNQSTGVYCFDNYVRLVREKGIKLCGQFHDEMAFPILEGQQDETTAKLRQSIKEVNEIVKLNVELGISIDYGYNYADIH